MPPIDEARLVFDQQSLFFLNICLAVVMFTVALGLHFNDFKSILRHPKPVIIGLISQFILLPLLTFLLVFFLRPEPGIALGMILVAACPGGNISNFISQLAGGNAALSVSLTAFATLLSLFFTPFNIEFWGNLYSPASGIMTTVLLDPIDVFSTIVLVIGLPLIAGIVVHHYSKIFSEKLARILKPLSIIILVGIISMAFVKNMDLFLRYFSQIVFLVLIHNALALFFGWLIARAGKLGEREVRSVSIETGIQNSALGLVLIFGFFNGLGGMAIVAGWWGIWHLISGMALAVFWKQKSIQV